MFGLLLKDLFTIRRQLLWYGMMIAVFCVLSALSKSIAMSAGIGILVTVSIPLSAFAYEEKEGWQKFVLASGTPIKTIVFEKYFLGFAAFLFSFIGNAIVFFCIPRGETGWAQLIVPSCMQFVLLSLLLPLVFRFGVEKGRAYMLGAVLAFIFLIVGGMTLIENERAASAAVMTAVAVPLTVVVLIGSFLLSVKIYKKRQQ